jgi:hypothetical protein
MKRRALVLTNESARHPIRRMFPPAQALEPELFVQRLWLQFLLGWLAGFVAISFFIW